MYLIGLQYGVFKSTIYFAPKLSHFPSQIVAYIDLYDPTLMYTCIDLWPQALAGELNDTNRRACAENTRPLVEAVESLTTFASSPQFASTPAKISAQARLAQEPILMVSVCVCVGWCVVCVCGVVWCVCVCGVCVCVVCVSVSVCVSGSLPHLSLGW